MNRKPGELQYLVDGDDGFLYIIHQQSIVVGETHGEIEVDMDIMFQWPEESVSSSNPELYRGTIFMCSENEAELQTVKGAIEKERNKHKRPLSKPKELLSKEDVNSKESNEKSPTNNTLKRKETANTLAAKESPRELPSKAQSRNNPRDTSVVPYQFAKFIADVTRTLMDMCTSLHKLKVNLETFSKNCEASSFDVDQGWNPIKDQSSAPSVANSLAFSPMLDREDENSNAKRNVAGLASVEYGSSSEKSYDDDFNIELEEMGLENIDDDIYVSTQETDNYYADNIQDDPSALDTFLKETIQRHNPDSAQPKKETSRHVQINDDDSMWTLKHTSKETGKIELVVGTKIFVEKERLDYILRKSKNQTQLARSLMEAVFTPEALTRCSLWGKRKVKNDTEKRQGLYKSAVDAILAFTRNYAKMKKWEPVDDRIVEICMHAKLAELRRNQKSNTK